MGQSLSEALSALLVDGAGKPSAAKKSGSASQSGDSPEASTRESVTEILRRVCGGFDAADGDRAADSDSADGGVAPALDAQLSSFGLDRLGVIELAIRCEEELGVRVEDDDIAGFHTLGDVVDYITARTSRTESK